MSNNFYSNDLMVKIRVDDLMADAEAYRRAMQVEQGTVSDQTARHIAVRPFGWIRRLVLRIGAAGV